MTYEMDFSEERSVLTLGGDLTLVNAVALKSVVVDCMKKVGELHVAFRNISQADLSLLQLLCAAHRSAVEMNKGFSTDARTDETLADLIRRSGFLRHRGCLRSGNINCLWLGLAQK